MVSRVSTPRFPFREKLRGSLFAYCRRIIPATDGGKAVDSGVSHAKLQAEHRTGTWARIVPPCTILASGFVRTKPAYLKLFISTDTRSEKLHYANGQSVIMLTLTA